MQRSSPAVPASKPKNLAEAINAIGSNFNVTPDEISRLKKLDTKGCDAQGRTPLMCAVIHANLPVIEWFFKTTSMFGNGRDPYWAKCDNNGMNVLMHAVNYDSEQEDKEQKITTQNRNDVLDYLFDKQYVRTSLYDDDRFYPGRDYQLLLSAAPIAGKSGNLHYYKKLDKYNVQNSSDRLETFKRITYRRACIFKEMFGSAVHAGKFLLAKALVAREIDIFEEERDTYGCVAGGHYNRSRQCYAMFVRHDGTDWKTLLTTKETQILFWDAVNKNQIESAAYLLESSMTVFYENQFGIAGINKLLNHQKKHAVSSQTNAYCSIYKNLFIKEFSVYRKELDEILRIVFQLPVDKIYFISCLLKDVKYSDVILTQVIKLHLDRLNEYEDKSAIQDLKSIDTSLSASVKFHQDVFSTPAYKNEVNEYLAIYRNIKNNLLCSRNFNESLKQWGQALTLPVEVRDVLIPNLFISICSNFKLLSELQLIQLYQMYADTLKKNYSNLVKIIINLEKNEFDTNQFINLAVAFFKENHAPGDMLETAKLLLSKGIYNHKARNLAALCTDKSMLNVFLNDAPWPSWSTNVLPDGVAQEVWKNHQGALIRHYQIPLEEKCENPVKAITAILQNYRHDPSDTDQIKKMLDVLRKIEDAMRWRISEQDWVLAIETKSKLLLNHLMNSGRGDYNELFRLVLRRYQNDYELINSVILNRLITNKLPKIMMDIALSANDFVTLEKLTQYEQDEKPPSFNIAELLKRYKEAQNSNNALNYDLLDAILDQMEKIKIPFDMDCFSFALSLKDNHIIDIVVQAIKRQNPVLLAELLMHAVGLKDTACIAKLISEGAVIQGRHWCKASENKDNENLKVLVEYGLKQTGSNIISVNHELWKLAFCHEDVYFLIVAEWKRQKQPVSYESWKYVVEHQSKNPLQKCMMNDLIEQSDKSVENLRYLATRNQLGLVKSLLLKFPAFWADSEINLAREEYLRSAESKEGSRMEKVLLYAASCKKTDSLRQVKELEEEDLTFLLQFISLRYPAPVDTSVNHATTKPDQPVQPLLEQKPLVTEPSAPQLENKPGEILPLAVVRKIEPSAPVQNEVSVVQEGVPEAVSLPVQQIYPIEGKPRVVIEENKNAFFSSKMKAKIQEKALLDLYKELKSAMVWFPEDVEMQRFDQHLQVMLSAYGNEDEAQLSPRKILVNKTR